MIKVSVFYPNTPSNRFDMDYYRANHMAMLKEKLSPACTHFSIDQGIAGGSPGAVATYVAITHLVFESMASFQSTFGPHAKAISKDIPNYTDVVPVVQISQMLAT